MRLTVKAILLCVVALAALSVRAAVDDVSCPMVRIVPERLPDMNIPRSGQDKIVETDGKVGAYRIRPSAAVGRMRRFGRMRYAPTFSLYLNAG